MARRRSGPEILAQTGELLVQRDGDRPSGRLLRQGDMDASYVDLADARYLEFDYLRRMRDLVEAAGAPPGGLRGGRGGRAAGGPGGPGRVGRAGGAGAARARPPAPAAPGPRQEVIELDP